MLAGNTVLPLLAVSCCDRRCLSAETVAENIFRKTGVEWKMLIGPEIPWKKAGFEARQEGNTSCDSFMSSLVLLLINIFIRFVSWEEHYPWVRSEFIFVNYSLTLLIHFSTGCKTTILLLVWFAKEKPNKITKQIEGEDSDFRFSEWYKEEKWQKDATVTKISCVLVYLSCARFSK